MATYKQTKTSADIGQVPEVNINIPPVDDTITAQQERAASLYANPQQLLAGLGRPTIAQTAATAGLSGLQAGMAMPTASPELAMLTGALTGMKSYGGLEQQQRQQQIAELDLIPIEQISPALVEAFPEAKGIPLGVFQKLSGLFSAMSKQKTTEAKDVLDENDLPSIEIMLESKGYSDPAERKQTARALLGQTWSMVKGLKARAEAFMTDEEPTIVTLANGLQAAKTRTRTGYKYNILPGQILTDTERSRIPLADEAIRESDTAKDLVMSDKGYEYILKAGGDFGKLASFKDTDAQRVYRAVNKMADARMRILTGAAANRSEVEMYFNNMFSRLYTKDTVLANIEQEKQFFNEYLGTLKSGRVPPSYPKKEPKPQPSGANLSDDAFNSFLKGRKK